MIIAQINMIFSYAAKPPDQAYKNHINLRLNQ